MDSYSTQVIGLLSAQRWLALAIVDDDGLPTISYIPYAIAGNAFGIVVSRLSAHTAPLLARRPASVLFVDTETQTTDAYTRARLAIRVSVSPQDADTAAADTIWSALEQRQGETARTLRALPDFSAISLEPIDGRLVLGFASARDLSASTIAKFLEHAS
jgi:putative heme iron utilization protein